MKKIFLAVSISCFMAACGNTNNHDAITTNLIDNPASASASKMDKDNTPFFEFEEKVKNFGKITQGEKVTTNFKFRNVGKTDLIISSAQGSCGCTVPKWPKEPIKPGERGIIKVTFNSAGKSGMQNKTVTLVANTIPNTTVIALKGEVLTPSK